MTLADSNLVIHSIDPAYPTVRAWLRAELPAVSGVTRVEALGYHKRTPADEAGLLAVFALLTRLPVTSGIEDEAIHLRRMRNMDLGDALIAATALVHGYDLATRNLKDFAGIPGLHAFDPS